MSSDPSWGLQLALVAKLKGTAAVTALVGTRIYDHFPILATYPAIGVGTGDQVIPLDEDDACTDGSETFLQVQVFSRDEPEPSFGPAKQIVGAILDALRNWSPTVAGHVFDQIEYRGVTYFRDEGLTSRGVMTFRVLTQRLD